MASKLAAFIREHRTQDSAQITTHVLVGAPFGKINVSNTNAKRFWEIYLEVAADGCTPLYFAERPLGELPVLVDVDLKIHVDGGVTAPHCLYSEEQVLKVINAYQTAIKEVVEKPIENPTDLACVLLEKPPYIVECNGVKSIKSGFHLHFPKIFLDVNAQEAYIIPIVRKNLAGLFAHEMAADFIDSCCLKVHWLMYGSKKDSSLPYRATRVFIDGCEETTFEEALGDYVLPKLTGDDRAQTVNGRVEFMLPRILSTRLHGRDLYHRQAKNSVDTPAIAAFSRVKANRTVYVQRTVDETLKEVDELFKLIHESRADNRSDWLNIGFCLWNITRGDEEGMMKWLEFSDKSDKYDEAECICIWSKMHPSQYTIGTLRYFAKLDNFEGYMKLCKSKSDRLIDLAVDGHHNDLAKLLFNEYGEEFVYSECNQSWYRFENHIWTKSTSTCYDLSSRISDDNGVILAQFNDHMSLAMKAMSELENSDEDRPEPKIRQLKSKIAMLKKIIRSCKTSGFKTSVMKECCEVFRNRDFLDKLNKTPFLVAFKNGVFDFEHGGQFRPGKPEDYLSVAIPTEYDATLTMQSQDVIDVDNFFQRVLPDDEVRGYFLDQVCQLFVGGNDDKLILIWTGSGDNGKSVTQRLFEKMLGPLGVKVTTSLITGQKQRLGSASPEMSRMGNGVRWVVMDEPNKDEQITTGLLKSLTGNDTYWARDLYQGGNDAKEIVPLFKLHLLCNKLPEVNNPDDAFWNRVRVILFESKFKPLHLCPKTEEEQTAQKIFPQDPKLANKAKQWSAPLAFFLINRWQNLNPERATPSKVLMATQEYREDNSEDVYRDFADEMLSVGTEDDRVRADELYERFKIWFKMSNPNDKVANKVTVVREMAKVLKSKSKIEWKGWKWVHIENNATKHHANPLLE